MKPSTQHSAPSTMICPDCQSVNHADASFCLECGTPLDEESLAERPTPPPKVAAETVSFDLTRLLKPMRGSWPVRIVALIALVALLTNWAGSTAQQAESDLYQAARQAQTEHRWHTAVSLFQQLTAKSYYDAATHLKQVQAQANSFDDFFGKGKHAETLGLNVMAAYYYDRANQIEPGYLAVDVTLNRLRRDNGRVLYRIAGQGQRDGLYVMEADGGVSLKIPESRADSVVLATSPDGRLVVFDDQHDGNLHLYVKDTQSYDTYTINLPRLEGTGRYPQQEISVALLDDGKKLLALDGGYFGYSNDDPGKTTSAVAYMVSLGNAVQINSLGVVDAIAFPTYTDQAVYYTDNSADLFTYSIATSQSRRAFTPDEHIYYMQPLANDQLLYSTYSSITVTLYTASAGNWAAPRKLTAFSTAERPYGTLQPLIVVSPNSARLLIALRTRAKGLETHLFALAGTGAAQSLRDATFPISNQLNMVGFSNTGLGLLLDVQAQPSAAQSPPANTLTALDEGSFGYFFTYPYLSNDTSKVVKAAEFLSDAYVYYVVSQNGATREQVMGDIMVSQVNYPNFPVKLAQVNTDTLGNWQPVALMGDQNTLMYTGNAQGGQGIYISETDGKQPLKVMSDAVAFWRLGGQ